MHHQAIALNLSVEVHQVMEDGSVVKSIWCSGGFELST